MTDIRVKKTKEAIQKVFKEMLCNMEINKITVKALTDKAQINRKTFYLHYDTIDGLINEFLDEIIDCYIQEIDKLPKGRSHEVANRLFFEHFAKQEEYVQKILCYPGYKELCNRIFDQVYVYSLAKDHPYRKFTKEKQNIIQTFYRSTTLDIYRQWIKDNRRMPLEEVIELSNLLICHGVTSIELI